MFRGLVLKLLDFILVNSYHICLPIAIVCIFLYIAGYKKGAKIATGSTIIYFILQAFRSTL